MFTIAVPRNRSASASPSFGPCPSWVLVENGQHCCRLRGAEARNRTTSVDTMGKATKENPRQVETLGRPLRAKRPDQQTAGRHAPIIIVHLFAGPEIARKLAPRPPPRLMRAFELQFCCTTTHTDKNKENMAVRYTPTRSTKDFLP